LFWALSKGCCGRYLEIRFRRYLGISYLGISYLGISYLGINSTAQAKLLAATPVAYGYPRR